MAALPSATHIADVCLRVRRLDSVADFYRDVLGFKELTSGSREKRLSANGNEPAQIVLIEDRSAIPRQLSAPGLFHTAFLLPSRRGLATALRRLIVKNAPLQGFADHGVSEAIYLADPEGNGIELYRDRPRDSWVMENGSIAMVTDPLDVDGLLREPGPANETKLELDPGTVVGHIHLQVSNLAKAEEFYHRLLGFDITQRSYPGALFVSAGGYHHHIGLNIWNSKNSAPLNGAAGLLSFGIHVPDQKGHDAIATRLDEHQYPLHSPGYGQTDVHDFDDITVRIYSSISTAHQHSHNHS